MQNSHRIVIGLMCGASALCLAPLASAQTAAAAKSSVEEIVVTGSRTIANGNNSPTPVTVVSTQQLEATTPSSVSDALEKLPVFQGSSNVLTRGPATSNAAGSFLSLRGFGSQRTLILFDGRRVPATASNGNVDTNTLPQMLMQRVDVVTGGASAVYGSDAVTGVVNFVLDHKLEGLKMQAQGGFSSQSDDGSYKAGIAGGKSLMDGRLHVEGSFEYYNSDGIADKFARANGRAIYCVPGAGTATNPFTLITNCRLNNSSFGGLITSGPLNGQQFVANGVLGPFVHGKATGTSTAESGGDGIYQIGNSLASKLQTQQAFAGLDYEVSDSIKAYAQFTYAQAKNNQTFNPASFNTVNLSTSNGFLSPAIQAQLKSTGASTFTFNRFFANEDQTDVDAITTNTDFTVGFKAALAKGWSLDAYYTMGRSVTHVRNVGVTNNQTKAAGMDAVLNPATGQVVCNVTLTNPGLYPGCIPINPFGPTAQAAGALAYERGTTEFFLHNDMDDVGVNLTGDLFSTWAGPVRVALSGERRSLELNNVTNFSPTTLADCTGLRFNCTQGTTVLWGNNVTAPVDAKETITEGAFEASVPLLREVAFADSLDLNGAVRYANYSISGNATTWKIGVDWHVNKDISFRATRSQDIRAPTLFDLYQPSSRTSGGFSDLHTGVNINTTTVSQGNPNLVPEVAQTVTVGVVLRPSFIPRFSVSIDYFDINMNNAINNLSGGNASVQAICEASGGTSPYCSLYNRPLPFSNHTAANFPTNIYSSPQNAAQTWTHGIDAEINYGFELGDVFQPLKGRVDLRALGTYQPVLTTVTLAGQTPLNAAGAANQPAEKVSFLAHYTLDRFSFDWQTRWRSSEHWSNNPALFYNIPDVAAVAFSDLTLTYKLHLAGRDVDSFLSVQNVFDTQPPPYANGTANPNFNNSVTNGDDLIGRYYTLGFRARF